MPLYSQPNFTSGLDDVVFTTAQSVPILPIMILITVYLIVLIGGSSNQKRRIGTADYPFWAVLGGITTSFLALIFTIGVGILTLTTLGIIIAITIMSGIWFFLSKVRGET